MTINQRIKLFRESLDLNKSAFAAILGKSAMVVTNIEDGRNKPGWDVLEKLLEAYPALSAEWLMRGAGSMLAATNTHNKEFNKEQEDREVYADLYYLRQMAHVLQQNVAEKMGISVEELERQTVDLIKKTQISEITHKAIDELKDTFENPKSKSDQ